ncbi:MAG: NAD-binding protein [Desulfobacterales bacterium]|nr:NAD-binding protein [Desulfobacterales bacterium]
MAVLGGGNVAMDSARTALRLGADQVYLVYRRSADEMPARIEEVHHAEEEGIEFHLLTNPIRYIGNDKGLGDGRGVHQDGTGRARRLRPAQAGPHEGQRVRHRRRHGAWSPSAPGRTRWFTSTTPGLKTQQVELHRRR